VTEQTQAGPSGVAGDQHFGKCTGGGNGKRQQMCDGVMTVARRKDMEEGVRARIRDPEPRSLLLVTTVAVTLRAFLLPLASHFRSMGWRVDALASGATSCRLCREGFDQVFEASWGRNPFALGQNLRAAREVRAVVRRGGYDLVHVHTPVAAWVTRLALRLRSGHPRVVYTAHGFHFFHGNSPIKNVMFMAMEKLASEWTDAVVVLNGEDEEQAHKLGLAPDGRILHMPGIGVDLCRYSPDAVSPMACERLRSELKLCPDQRVFLQVADFVPRKRHGDLLRAFARVPRPSRLLLAGDGPELARAIKLAADLGIADRVDFLGVRTDVPALMKIADAVVLVSSQEGLPRCVLEAMAMGRAVVGTRIRGTKDLLEDGAGILVGVGDIDAISAAMRQVMDCPIEVGKMGMRGRELAGRYDLRNIVGLHEELYAQVLE